MDKGNLEESKNQMGGSKTPGENGDDHSEASNEDLEEFQRVSDEIDSLNQVLDTMENNVDNIKDQLMSILMSNREILKELKEEREKSGSENSEESENDKMET